MQLTGLMTGLVKLSILFTIALLLIKDDGVIVSVELVEPTTIQGAAKKSDPARTI